MIFLFKIQTVVLFCSDNSMCFLYTRCEPCGQPVRVPLQVSARAIHHFIFAIIEKLKQKNFPFRLTTEMYCPYLVQKSTDSDKFLI